MTITDKIIVPLDVPSIAQAIGYLDILPQVNFWKVGLELFIAEGGEILKILRQRDKRIFLDLKLHDIPNTVANACKSVQRYGVDFLTVHATAGRQALELATKVLKDNPERPKLLAITLLTSINAQELAFDLKVPLELPEYALNMALMAQECGIDGAVCSPHEVKQLREICGVDFTLVCPGVRPEWSQKGDQSRVMTPFEALQAGADYLVIGRPITAADDPVEAWEKIRLSLLGVRN